MQSRERQHEGMEYLAIWTYNGGFSDIFSFLLSKAFSKDNSIRVSKLSATFLFSREEVSKKVYPFSSEKFSPSSEEISLFYSKSVLFPNKIIFISFLHFSSICSQK